MKLAGKSAREIVLKAYENQLKRSMEDHGLSTEDARARYVRLRDFGTECERLSKEHDRPTYERESDNLRLSAWGEEHQKLVNRMACRECGGTNVIRSTAALGQRETQVPVLKPCPVCPGGAAAREYIANLGKPKPRRPRRKDEEY